MNKQATNIQLLGYSITILLFVITSYVMVTNRVTALETHATQQKDINSRVEQKLDYIIDLIIDKNNYEKPEK
ncbi:MAG: hypothetical protein ACOYO1_19720 [Bacteroidales bacterium]